MEDEDGEDLTPFWVQSTTNVRRADRLRRRAADVLLSSGLVVFLLVVTAVFFLVFIVPSTVSFSAQIFRPNSVKKSWDSLNIFLVLVAVVFGFLSRNKNEEKFTSYYDEFQDSARKPDGTQKTSTTERWYKSNYPAVEGRKSDLNSNQWYEYSGYEAKLEHKNSILRRNSSSYPDLREFPATNWSYGDYYQRRYFDDDIHVDTGRVWVADPDLGLAQTQLHRRHRSLEAVELLRAPAGNKTVIVDTLLIKSKRGENSPEIEENLMMSDDSSARLKKDLEPLGHVAAQRSSPAAVAVPEADSPRFLENSERAYQRGARKREKSGRKRNKDVEVVDPITTPHSQALPSPPSSPPRHKSSKSDRKRGGSTGNPTKDFLNSLYQKKKKKQRQKSVDNLDPLLQEAQALSFQIPPPSPSPPPPPPPPPPPQTSVFQNLFSTKKHKRKRTITVTLAPQQTSPPLPQPPPMAARDPEPISQAAPPTTHKPPTASKTNSLERLEITSNSGGESPLNRIPPPPPPPPVAFFKTPVWKFVVQGDYVRVNSVTSSRSGSPDTDDGDSDFTASPMDAGGAVSPFCPSPDVNTKAESFITNFRAKLQLEKNHSLKKREVGLSGLGPSQFSRRT